MNFVSRYNDILDSNCGDAFVGANSGKGFIGNYENIINEAELKRLYVIKGAAGTGKSTFMRKLASYAQDLGADVKKYMCSSDCNSLDAVVISDSVAVIDGTSPHAYELKYPGAASEILDHTKFWDNAKLVSSRNRILEYCDAKNIAYSEAYMRLKCELKLRQDSNASVAQAIDYEKMQAQIKRFITTFAQKVKHGPERCIMVRSVGMKGRYKIPLDCDKYSTVVYVSDFYGSAYRYLRELADQLINKNIEHIIKTDPVCTDMICDLEIPSVNMIITLDEVKKYDKTVNMMRFIKHERLSELRGFLRLSAKCIKMFEDEADRYFANAGKAHFELEKIYGDAMNFDFLNTYSEIKIKEILDYVKL